MKSVDKFQKSLEELDLQGIILLQGLLAQRALQLMTQPKEARPSAIIQPEKALVL
jgi:hypothetical protein